MRGFPWLSLSFLVLASAFASRAGATLIAVPMSGTIFGVSDPTNVLGGAIVTGESFSFTLGYENGGPDYDPDPASGTYLLTSFTLAGQVGGVAFQYDGVSSSLAYLVDSQPGDTFGVTTDVTLGTIPGSFSSSLTLDNPAGLTLSNDDLTGVPFSFGLIGGWISHEFRIDGPNWSITGYLTGMNGVPEPTTALLLAGGLVAIAAGRRKRG